MKILTFTLIVVGLLIVSRPSSASGQINLGNVLRDGVQRGAQQIRGEIRNNVQGIANDWTQGQGPGYRVLPPPRQNFSPGIFYGQPQYPNPYQPPSVTLPYPPPAQTLPYPNPPVSQPIIRPLPQRGIVVRPVDPPICQSPIQVLPVTNHQTFYPSQPRTQQPAQHSTQGQRPAQQQTTSNQAANPASGTETRAENLPTVITGQEVAIDGEGFGNQLGSVRVKVGGMILLAETTSWSDTSVDAVIPNLPLVEPTDALIAVINSEKQVVQQLAIRLAAAEKNPADNAASETAQAETEGADLPVVQMGMELELAGNELGTEPGKVQLNIGDSKLEAAVIKWSDDEATIRIPDLPLAQSMRGTIQLILANGQPVSEIPVMFAK